MALELIKISEFPESVDTKDWFVVGDVNGVAYKLSKDNLEAELGINALMQFGGAIVPASTPEPTGDYFWIATEEGTYINFGGVVVPAASMAVISRINGVFTSSITTIPQPEGKIETWVAGTYSQGDQRIHNGQIWSVNVASTTEEPGAGLAWVPDLDMIQESDLTIEQSINLARPENLLENFYIGSSGNKSSGAGWWTYRVFCNPGDYVTFGNFNIATGGNLAFYVANDNPANTGTAIGLVQFAGSYTNGALPKTVQAPLNEPTVLYIPVARPSNSPEDWAEVMINFGQELMPYVPAGRVTRIKGYSLESEGEAYDQSLNTTNDVKFASVETGGFSAVAFQFEGEEWDGVDPAPPEIQIGDVYFNTTINGLSVRRA